MNYSNSHMFRTDPKWFYFLKDINANREINFWRKDIKEINNINENDRIYFLRKKTKTYPKIAIIGMAEFVKYEVLTINEAWDRFKKNNGCSDIYEFSSKFSSNIQEKIGCLILRNLIFFEDEYYLSDVNISFSPKIQSRKSLSLLEENNILNLLNGKEIIEFIPSYNENIIGEDVNRLVKSRVNQTYFRYSLINIYKKCVLCGLSNEKLLRASHSKPWSESNANEKVDPMNGLLLCANHDLLYDKHLISFDENKKVIISPLLKDSDLNLLNIYKDLYINVPDKAMQYISYHREKFNEKIEYNT